MSKRPQLIVGHGERANGERVPVVNGGYLLYMKDSQGITLDTTIGILEGKGWTFDVIGYFAACNLNPNYGMEASLRMLESATDVEWHPYFEASLVYFLDNKDEYLKKYANQAFHLL